MCVCVFGTICLKPLNAVWLHLKSQARNILDSIIVVTNPKEEKQIILHFFTKGDFLRRFRTLRNETRRVTNTTTWNEQSSKRKNQRLECGDTRYKSPLLAAVVGWSFNLHQQPYKNTKNKPNQKKGLKRNAATKQDLGKTT